MDPATPLRRLESLDIVRGVAVMGILLMNIVAFGLPEAAYMNPRAYGGWHGSNYAVYIVNFILFDGKMRGLFSFLFGASMLMVIERAEATGKSAARVHYARMAWLLVFGLAHLWLVWWGDILSLYAPVGMIAFFFRNKAAHRLVIAGVLMLVPQFAFFVLLAFQIQGLEIASAAPHASAAALRGFASYNNQFGVPPHELIARELAIYRSDYPAIVAARFREDMTAPIQAFFTFGLETLAYMLFGMAALKSGLLAGAWTRVRYVRLAIIGFAIGLLGYGTLAWLVTRAGFTTSAVTFDVLALPVPIRPFMILGWASLILLLAQSGGAFSRRLEATGRMAFTNYLLTSLICTSLFYGYGLGWFGLLDRAELYVVVLFVWGGMLIWSKPWLEHFQYGPLEWLWRSLSRGRLQPLRGAALRSNNAGLVANVTQ